MLKIRSGYSFRAAAGKIDKVLDRLQELGHTVAPITDRSSTFAFYRWKKACEERSMRPVFGVELAVTDSINAKKPATDYWTFIAQGSIEPINALVTLATTQFRYQPLLTLEQALSAKGVFKMTGHRPPMALWDLPPQKDTAVLLGPSTAVGVAKRALATGWQFAASSDNRYPTVNDKGFYEVLTGRNAETQTYPQHILSRDEWLASIAYLDLPEASKTAAEGLSALWLGKSMAQLLKSSLPKFAAEQSLLQLCQAGARKLDCDLSRPEYDQRMKRELSLIREKGYEDYFYIVADICTWARERMLVGPARGSSCGSLVCYLLGITTVDPIPFGLIFERFVDINRSDMPDIDIDFSDQQRHQVFRYIEKKYGLEHVARLGTVAMFQARSALSEVGIGLNIPKWIGDAVAESMIERSSGDSRALNTLEDTLKTMPAGQRLMAEYPEASVVAQFEGHPRHYSQHAAGVVISAEPLRKFVAIDHRTGATMCDKKDAEDGYNLLKIDCLGLTQLSVFEDALELAGLPMHALESLPLDDPKAFNVLNEARWSGIFQFNGQALQSITKQFTVDKFDDIVSVTALGRPGPLASGGAHEWIRRRNGTNPVTYPHPIFEPYLGDTLGIVLYQEQVMEIGRNIGGLSWEQVTLLRKAMSKSLGKEYFDQFGDPWKAGAIAKGVAPKAADKIWDDLCAYGAWSFNKSHSVAYGLISYWCVVGSTIIYDWDNKRYITIAKAFRDGINNIACYDEKTGKTISGKVKAIIRTTGAKNINLKMGWRLRTKSAKHIECSAEHKFLTPTGYCKLKDLRPGDLIASEKRMSIMTKERRAAIAEGVRKDWDQMSHAKREEKITKMAANRTHAERSVAAKAGWAAMDEEKREQLARNLISSAKNNGYDKRMVGIHPICGHRYASSNEKAVCDWLCQHEIEHESQVRIKGGFADWKIKGVYVEYDGVDRPESYFEARYGVEPYIVIKSRAEIEQALSFTLEEELLRAGAIVTFEPIVSITQTRPKVMYDISMEDEPHNFLANGIVVHNCCWLKAYHPFEFAAATLSHEDDPTRQIQLLREMRSEGYDYVPVDPEISGRKWAVGEKDGQRYLVGPLHNVKGIGPKMVNQIIGSRNRGEPLPDRCKKLLTNPVTDIDSLWPVRDGFARLLPDPLSKNIVTHPTPIVEAQVTAMDQEFLFFCTLSKINPRDENEVVIVARRGHRIEDGKTTSLNLQLTDDTDTIFGKVDRWKFEKLGRSIVDHGRIGKALYAIKGRMRANTSFRMITVSNVRYIGDLDK